MLAEQITDPTDYLRAVRTAEEHAAWEVVAPLLEELIAADVVLLGVPMYNFSVPAALKGWIDQITFPRMNLSGRTFVVVSGRGGSYAPGAPRAPYDHHERYLRDFFSGHYAVDDVHFVHAELTNALVDPRLVDRRREHGNSHTSAIAQVEVLAAKLVAR